MGYSTVHFAPTARGSGDGSTYDNAAEAFPSGNWPSQITANDYSAAGIVALFQNTGPYTLSQVGSAATFSSTVPGITTYGVDCLACDANGNIVTPADIGWKCSQGDLDSTGFAELTYTQTSAFINNVKIGLRCFKTIGTNITGSFLNGPYAIIDWCDIQCTTTGSGTAVIPLSISTNSAGVSNSQVTQSGGYSRAIAANTCGVVSNIRVIGDAAAATGTRYGIAVTSNAVIAPINGPVFVKDHPGAGIVNYKLLLNASLQLSRATVCDCGVGIASFAATSGGTSLLLIADSVITGCTYGLSQQFGRYDLRNVVLRNSTDFEYAAETPVFDPLAIITTETDSQLYADHVNGDYRIKTISDHWGKNRGAQDAPSTGGGGITQARLNHIKNMMRHGVSI